LLTTSEIISQKSMSSFLAYPFTINVTRYCSLDHCYLVWSYRLIYNQWLSNLLEVQQASISCFKSLYSFLHHCHSQRSI